MSKEKIENAIRVTSDTYGAAWLLGVSPFKFLRLCADHGVSHRKVRDV